MGGGCFKYEMRRIKENRIGWWFVVKFLIIFFLNLGEGFKVLFVVF